MCAATVAIDRFSASGATAQPANSSVKNATTVRLTAPPLSILFFMNPSICLIRPAQHRFYSTPSDKKGLRHEPPLASQDRARIVFDCRMADDPAMMPSTNPALVLLIIDHAVNWEAISASGNPAQASRNGGQGGEDEQ
jgi:hypothetical protein